MTRPARKLRLAAAAAAALLVLAGVHLLSAAIAARLCEKRARTLPAEEWVADGDWKEDLRRKLERKVSFEFANTPLDEALGYLQTMTDVPIIQDPAAFSGGRDPRQPITLKLTDTRLDEALRWITRLVDLGYTLKRRAIFISTRANCVDEVETRVYDVRELAALQAAKQARDFAAGSRPVTPMQPGGVPELVRKMIEPQSWGGPFACTERNGWLVVTHRPEVHGLVERLLADLRKSLAFEVSVEVRAPDVREGFLEEIGVDWGEPGTETEAQP